MKVAFVYPNPRTALLDKVAAGEAPDTALLGQNHLHEHGVDARIHQPRLRRRERRQGLRHRLTWNLRELTLPWEVGDVDLVVTSLANLFPLVARMRGRPRVLLLSYHLAATYARSSRPRRRLLRAVISASAGVVCMSTAGRDRLLALTGADPRNVHAALLGVDERFWTPAAPAQNGYVLTVGRDLARDYATFARAVEGLPVRALIAAGPANLAAVDLPANAEARFDIGADEVKDLYAGAGCVVVPTRREDYRYGTENSGTIALLEAMASGRPVVVTERSTLAEYVRAGETALTVAPEDPAALRAAIETLLGDPERARKLGERGRRQVEESHTTRHFAARLAGIIDSLEP